eukprot:gene12294-5877_t
MSFDKRTLVIHFGSVFTNKKIGDAFKKFLEMEKNPETFQFLLDVQKINSCQKNSDKIKKIQEIIDTYLDTNSKSEINVSISTKKFITTNFEVQKKEKENWILTMSPEEFLEPIYYSVYEELRQDSFHRFIRTKSCDDVVKKYLNDSTVVSPYITKQFNYKDEEFTKGIIFDVDFEMAKSICEDSFSWELIPSTKKNFVNAYYTKSNYLPKISIQTAASKYECTIKEPFHRSILSFICDMSINSDPNFAGMKKLGYLNTNDLIEYFNKNKMNEEMKSCPRTVSQLRFDANFGFPFNMRSWSVCSSLHYEPETKSLYMIFKPFLKDFSKFGQAEMMEMSQIGSNEKKSLKAYHLFDFTFRKFQKLDENKTFYQEITFFKMGGWADNKSFISLVIKDRAAGLRKSITKSCSSFPEDVKISDLSKKFNELDEKSLPKDMLGKMLVDLDIEKMDQEFSESKTTNIESISIQ